MFFMPVPDAPSGFERLLGRLPAQEEEGWLSLNTFYGDRRKASAWESACGVGVDLDYLDGEGNHAALPKEAEDTVLGAAALGRVPGHLIHPTPGGATPRGRPTPPGGWSRAAYASKQRTPIPGRPTLFRRCGKPRALSGATPRRARGGLGGGLTCSRATVYDDRMGRPPARRTLLLAGAILAATGAGVGLAVYLITPGRDDAGRSHEMGVGATPSAILLTGRARALPPAPPTTTSEATARIRMSVSEGYPGKPIAGATVRIGVRSGGERVAATDANGLALFEGLRPGEVQVSVTAQGYANARDYWFTLKPDEDREIGEHLDVAETLPGRVLDAADGRPVEGAVVTAFEGGPVNMNPGGPPRVERQFGTATTDSRGTFAVEGVARDGDLPFSLRIVRVESRGRRTQWKIVPPQLGADGVVVRVQSGGTVEGVVRRPDGSPAAGATVLTVLDDDGRASPLWDEEHLELPGRYDPHSFGPAPSIIQDPTLDAWGILKTTADEAGRFVVTGLGLSERYAVAARADGFGTSETTRGVVLSRENPAHRTDLRLRGAHRLTVRVLDREGCACPGFSVRLDGAEAPTQGDTDSSGIAGFEVTPGTYPVRVWGNQEWHSVPDAVVHDSALEVVARLDLRAPRAEPTSRSARGSQESEPRSAPTTGMQRATTLLARIAVAEGSIPPKFIDIRGLTGGGSAYGGTEWTPDSSGTVPVAWSLDWPHYRLTVNADGFLPIVREVSGAPVDLGALVLSPGRTLEGAVVASDGATPSDLAVTARFRVDGQKIEAGSWFRQNEEPTFERVARTNAAGRFRIAGLPEGVVSLTVDDSRFLRYEATVDVPPQESPLRVPIRLGGVARVRVETAEGYPAPRRQVRIDPVEGERVFGSCAYGETDVEGGFGARLAPGTYRVRLTARSGDDEAALPASSQAVVTLEEGGTQDVRLIAAPR